ARQGGADAAARGREGRRRDEAHRRDQERQGAARALARGGAARRGRDRSRGDVVSGSKKPALLVTGADLAPAALALLDGFDVVYAGKTPSDDDIAGLCARHDPVAIIVRYGKVGA